LLSAAALLALTTPADAAGLFGKKKKSCSTEQTTSSTAGKAGCASGKTEGKGCCSKKAATSTSSTAPSM
jgi:hypothetical protein